MEDNEEEKLNNSNGADSSKKDENSKAAGKFIRNAVGNTHGLAKGFDAACEIGSEIPVLKKGVDAFDKQVGKTAKKIPGGKSIEKVDPEILKAAGDALSSGKGGGKGGVPGTSGAPIVPGSKNSGSEIVGGHKSPKLEKPPEQPKVEANIDTTTTPDADKADNNGNKEAGAEGEGTVKKVAIPLIITFIVAFMPVLVIGVVLVIIFSASSNFLGLFGINSLFGGEFGEIEFVSIDEDIDEFLGRVQESIGYYDDSANIDYEIIVSTFAVMKTKEASFDYSDITVSRIRNFIDLGISESGGFSVVKYKSNLADEMKKYLPIGTPQEEIDALVREVETHIEDYYSLLGLDNEDGGACKVNTSTQSADLALMSTDEYIATMGPIAQANVSANQKAGDKMFASVLLAQSIEESGWGRSDLSVNHNNMFGIKCHGYPTCADYNTREEYTPGSSSYVTAGFRSYPDVEESLQDRYNFLAIDNTRYVNAGFFKATTPQQQIQTLKDAGYATSSSYVNNLNSLIDTYNLEKWDSSINYCVGGSAQYDIRTVAPTSSDYAFTLKSSNRGQCVWYAQARAIEAALDLSTKGIIDSSVSENIKNLLLNTYGNGGDWYNVSKANGYFEVSNDVNAVEAGSIISWSKPGGYGHVAFIEDVNQEDNTITITEGWADNTTSCPSHWGCVNFLMRTMTLDEYFSKFGPTYKGNYVFSGYIYTLKPLR